MASTMHRNYWRLLRSIRRWSDASDARGDIMLAVIATAMLAAVLVHAGRA